VRNKLEMRCGLRVRGCIMIGKVTELMAVLSRLSRLSS